jgi:hypothetical protein
MRLTLLHIQDCPNVATLRERLVQLVDEDAELTLRLVESQDQAVALGMTGSPTLLIDGRDPFAESGRSANLSCRLYRDETGRLVGAPSLAQLRDALISRPPPAQAMLLEEDEHAGAEPD